jgi:ferredoxin--NADP+ reductase
MAAHKETVLEVTHHTDRLFYFKTTRKATLRFRDGEFIMIGLDHWSEKLQRNKPIMRAYSVVSPNHADYLEFYSIKVPDGPLTSRLQNIKVGDEILVNSRAVGTLVNANIITPARNLYLLATGTGIAPFMSTVRGVETYEHYENVIVVWGTRTEDELAFKDLLNGLNEDEVYSKITQGKLKTYFTCTREAYENEGRVTTAMYENKVQDKLGLEDLSSMHDRVMICGSMEMNLELKEYLEELGFEEGNNKHAGSYVLEKSFVR